METELMTSDSSQPSLSQNQAQLLPVLQSFISQEKGSLLEIGRGALAHSAEFSAAFPHLRWVVADITPGSANSRWPRQPKCPNLEGGYQLVPGVDDFPATKAYDYVFLADVLEHISWKAAKTLFKLFSKRLRKDALVLIYAPLKLQGTFRSPEAEKLEQALKAQNPQAGIRHTEEISAALSKGGFALLREVQISADQWLLVFKRKPHV